MPASPDLAPPPDEWKAREIAARDREAAHYVADRRRSLGPYGERAQIRLLLSHARLTGRQHLLDAGCGVGRFVLAAAPRVRSALAVDFSRRSIEVLAGELQRRRIASIETRVGDLTTLLLPKSFFDVAVAAGVIHHLPSYELRLAALRRILSALKPGGRCLLTVYRWGGALRPPRPKEGMHPSGIYYFAFSPAEARRLMEAAGYTAVQMRGFLALPEPITWRLSARFAWIEPLSAALPWSTRRGRELLIIAKRPA